jgi:hypothetical protein
MNINAFLSVIPVRGLHRNYLFRLFHQVHHQIIRHLIIYMCLFSHLQLWTKIVDEILIPRRKMVHQFFYAFFLLTVRIDEC